MYQALRTGASFFFDLDVTQRRSADATEVLILAKSARVSFTQSPQAKREAISESKQMPSGISEYDKSIYRLLCRAFGQCVFVAKIIDLDVFNVVAIGNIHVAIDVACTGPGFTCRW